MEFNGFHQNVAEFNGIYVILLKFSDFTYSGDPGAETSIFPKEIYTFWRGRFPPEMLESV